MLCHQFQVTNEWMKETIILTLFILQIMTLDLTLLSKKLCIPMRTKLSVFAWNKNGSCTFIDSHRIMPNVPNITNTQALILRSSDARFSYALFSKSFRVLLVNLHWISFHYNLFHFNSLRLTTSGKENSYIQDKTVNITKSSWTFTCACW